MKPFHYLQNYKCLSKSVVVTLSLMEHALRNSFKRIEKASRYIVILLVYDGHDTRVHILLNFQPFFFFLKTFRTGVAENNNRQTLST